MTRVAILLLALAVAAVLALWWRRRDGRVVADSGRFTSAELAALGVPGGAVALVEFTAPHCAPCAAARQVLDEIADGDQVVVVAVDVGEPKGDDLARRHKVLRTPTTFVVAPDGSIRGRVSGVPHRQEVDALVGA
jgi:thiol-disulfide isomerase/thioredoxin